MGDKLLGIDEMYGRVWGDRIFEYEGSRKTDLLEIIEDQKIKINVLEAELSYEKLVTESLEQAQNIVCDKLAELIIENHKLKNKPVVVNLSELPELVDIDTIITRCYLNIMVKDTEFYKNSKDDPTDPLD